MQTLRRRLWEAYLGVGSNPSLKELIADPISDEVYITNFRSLARANTALYNKVFQFSLPDTIYTLADLRRSQTISEEARSKVEKTKLAVWVDKMVKDLTQVRGFLVEFPLHFLKDEQMSPTILDVEFVVPRNVFL